MFTGALAKIRQALTKTRQGIGRRLSALLSWKGGLDAEAAARIEEALISGDVGAETAASLIEDLRKRLPGHPATDEGWLQALREAVIARLPSHPGILSPAGKPCVILVSGVNGTGKTTSVAKLAHYLKQRGRSVLLAAADTFRAAASDQLSIWAQRAGVPVVSQAPGADPASVAFDAVETAVRRGIDYVLVDTAGRLHTKTSLMEEMAKIRRVIEKKLQRPVDESFLVLDATTGRNGLVQARTFHEHLGLTGVILTKIDSSARGGVALSIRDELKVPLVFVGTGETLESLEEFSAEGYADGLLSGREEEPE